MSLHGKGDEIDITRLYFVTFLDPEAKRLYYTTNTFGVYSLRGFHCKNVMKLAIVLYC